MLIGTLAHRKSMTRLRDRFFYSWRCVHPLLTDCIEASVLCHIGAASVRLDDRIELPCCAMLMVMPSPLPVSRPARQPAMQVTVRRSPQRMADLRPPAWMPS